MTRHACRRIIRVRRSMWKRLPSELTKRLRIRAELLARVDLAITLLRAHVGGRCAALTILRTGCASLTMAIGAPIRHMPRMGRADTALVGYPGVKVLATGGRLLCARVKNLGGPLARVSTGDQSILLVRLWARGDE
jgi:hypothetical protein